MFSISRQGCIVIVQVSPRKGRTQKTSDLFLDLPGVFEYARLDRDSRASASAHGAVRGFRGLQRRRVRYRLASWGFCLSQERYRIWVEAGGLVFS